MGTGMAHVVFGAARATMADGAYPEVVIPYRKPDNGAAFPQWQEDLNTVHRSARTRVEHARPG